MQRACNSCGVLKYKDAYSKKQLSKGAALRRCKDCVGGSSCTGAAGSSSASEKSRASKPKRSNAAKAATNTDKGPRVRVKDVQKHYGHLCEIPLRAYMDAGVAFSRKDLVSEEDVQAASDAWDARSIAYDIDTQWGAMPQGGAYKDSNHYWGPGIYDFY